MKLNRLLEITILLMNKKSVTAKELSDRFEVSTRTIYRDLDVLSASGVPVYTNKGKGGGISLLEDFTLNKTLISEQESESILLALKTLQATSYPEIDLILNKIGSVFKNSEVTDWVHIDFTPWGSNPHEHNKFQDIKKAIIERKVINFEYVNNEGEKSYRSIEPMQLKFKGFNWYLMGFCKSRNEFRIFRISRVKKVVVTSETFIRRVYEHDEDVDFTQSSKSLISLKLRFQPQALHRVYDDFEDEHITKNADGTIDVNVVLPIDDWIYTYIFSFGSLIEVLEPDSIRQSIVQLLERTLKQYIN